MLINVAAIVDLQTKMVERWHQLDVDNPHEGFFHVVCQEHQFNFLLWHEEDIARNPNVTDARIAQVKRAIDRCNQQRNDWIERIDDAITNHPRLRSVQCGSTMPLNTETPGSAIDRLSILSLRIYHLREQLTRADVDQDHRCGVEQKLAIAQAQQSELAHSLQLLLDDIFAGHKRHRVYRQMKMYNDPTLNPQMYATQLRRAG